MTIEWVIAAEVVIAVLKTRSRAPRDVGVKWFADQWLLAVFMPNEGPQNSILKIFTAASGFTTVSESYGCINQFAALGLELSRHLHVTRYIYGLLVGGATLCNQSSP